MASLDIIITIVCSSFLAIAYYFFKGHRTHVRIVTVRRIFMQNIARIETIVVQVNQLSNLATHVHDHKTFNRYEEILKNVGKSATCSFKDPPAF